MFDKWRSEKAIYIESKILGTFTDKMIITSINWDNE